MNEKIVLQGSVVVLIGITSYVVYSVLLVPTVKHSDVDASQSNNIATSSLSDDQKRIIEEVKRSTSTKAFDTKEWSATYRNDTYGFTFTFPDSWRSYRAKEVSGGIDFGIEDQDKVFSVLVYTEAEWEQKSERSKKAGERALPSIIGKSDTNIFTIERAQDFSEKVLPLIIAYPSILTTFKIIK